MLLGNSKFSKREKTHRIHDRFLVVEGGICTYFSLITAVKKQTLWGDDRKKWVLNKSL